MSYTAKTGSDQAPRKVSIAAAKGFLTFLEPSFADPLDAEPIFAFQTYDDDKARSTITKSKAQGRDFRARTFIGTFKQHAATLAAFNKDGCAVHVAINYVEGSARIEKNVKRIRKHFIENDGNLTLEGILARARELGLEPALVNESSPGNFHTYWNVADDVAGDVSGFRLRQQKLAAAFGAGRESVDPPRVLRLPGFYHQKREPFQVRNVYKNPDAPAYTIAGFERALADIEIPESNRNTSSGSNSTTGDDDAITVAETTEHFKSFPRAVSDTDTPDGKKGKKGNATTYDAFAKARDIGVSLEKAIELALEFYNPRCEPPWDEVELRTIATNAYTYTQGDAGKDNPKNDFADDTFTVTEEELNQWRESERKREQKRQEKRRGNDTVLFDWASDIAVRNISFIWPGRLAYGKHTALAGEGGKGKSQLAYKIAATISTGGEWPDGGKAPQGKVIILSAEDGANDVLVPRLKAAGANLNNIAIVKAVKRGEDKEAKFNLQEDLERLKAMCANIKDVKLIILDPVSSYMGATIDGFRNTAVRHVLDPITQLAEEVQTAILTITHFNKGSANGKAANKVMDSAAFVNAPRAAFGVFEDPDNGIGEEAVNSGIQYRLLLCIKTNIGEFPRGVKYHIERNETPVGNDPTTNDPIYASRVVWDDMVDITADQVVAYEAQQARDNSPRLREAMTFLREELADGPQPVSEVRAAAEANGITPDALRRARERLNVDSRPTPGQPRSAWMWSLRGELDLDEFVDDSDFVTED